MWQGPGQDPGGGPDSGPPAGSSQELFDLKDQFEQQQVLIAQLKEMIRKSEQSSVTQEKVDEYMNTLSKRSARAKKNKKDDDNGNRKTLDIPASQKISLLRQQVEENKAKFAERGKSQKGIEEMVTQLKAQLDDSQQLISQSPLNQSLQDTKTEYSENSSSQELYMVLLTKEKRITDLIAKVQKLESNVLDLQENVKEKDSVIDARTKAITLMTENLSRKGKNTLDALDETKEQMRKMQENFVALEAEMKARQMKLLDDLRMKNYEIAELQEQIQSNDKTVAVQQQLESLRNENDKLQLTIAQHEATIRALDARVERDAENQDVAKLKKQLDESNKNMIKVKAQHKSKVKELTKKLDAFKKISDANAEIVKLEAENCRLNQKVAELEEEKGSLQLKMVESDSAKGSDPTERESELEDTIQGHVTSLEEKDKIISILEAEIARLKNEIETLTEKLNGQVTSEMASIQFEEQMDSLENERKKLIMENESATKEKEDLLETIELLKKEKLEIASKLEHYIQENMELIDKLEKLSAEKVSSAESIEIVEALTQQEKLELEAYQKNLDLVAGNLKSSEENLPQVDLNESVNELTEETSELLQKIELFTVERREVMDKMEQLKQENNQLTLKIKEIENNRDVLAETYEQLQSEKELLDTKLETTEKENESLKEQLEISGRDGASAEAPHLTEENEALRLMQENEALRLTQENEARRLTEENEALKTALDQELKHFVEENEALKRKLDEGTKRFAEENEALSARIDDELKRFDRENEALGEQLRRLNEENEDLKTQSKRLNEENEDLKAQSKRFSEENEALNSKLIESERFVDEITSLRAELENMSALVKELQSGLDRREEEISQLNNSIMDHNRILTDYENDSKNLQIKLSQLEEQKAQLEQQIEKDQEEIEAVTNAEWENRRLLESKDNEIAKLTKERDNTESMMADLQRTIKDKDEKYHKISTELTQKYLTLQKQLEENSGNLRNITGPLEAKIEELTTKNKEQLEKMKKIAANLKKKTQAYQELEDRLKTIQEKHETELREKDAKLSEDADKIASLLQQLHELETEVSRLQELLNGRVQELRMMEEKNVELQATIADLRVKMEKHHEMSLQQELLQTQGNVGGDQISTNESSLQSKIQEMEMIIETKDSELVQYRERINKLEEGISFMEERRLSLERRANELGAQLEEKSVTCEEMTRSEDLLEMRLAALTAHDEAIEKKLEEAIAENQELNQQNQKLGEKNDKLTKKLEQMVEKFEAVESQQSLLDDLETQNEELKKQIHNFENELKNIQNDYERVLEENKNDLDKVNGDWQTQFDEILYEKNELMVRCERFEEELKAITEKEFGFTNELIEYKNKLESSEAEIRNYEERIRQVTEQNEELKGLKKTIEEKNAEIEEYQRQNLQLQMQTANSASFFDSPPQPDPELVGRLQGELDSSKLTIEEMKKKIEDLEGRTTAPIEVKSSAQEDIPTFVWSGHSEDPFDFIQETKAATQEAAPQPSENTHQELLSKIKTLEFMLFSVEKEKDDALLQCHELSNELTRLVYERENTSKLESQILPESDIKEVPREVLQEIEFEQTRPPLVSSLEAGPVVEEVVRAKDAYLCFDQENAPQLLAIDSQILSEAEIADSPAKRRELQQIEFEETKPPRSSTTLPIQEEPFGAKDAYLCYEGGHDTFGENDDGWGWGPEEAKLEEEYVQKVEAGPSRQIDSLREKIRVLELERDNHLEEIKQLQIKSGKLIKKLKEFKQKNVELNQTRKKSEGDLFSLDDTIQEELKLQIQQVEKRLKETTAELEKEKSEKVAILKRIDVLTAANERMVEMKEKQDIELLGWQQNYRDLSAKLEKFEWGDDGFSSNEPANKDQKAPADDATLEALNKKIQELNDTIKDLTLDNEELQTLLEEQRTLRINAEKSKSIETDPQSEAQILELNNQLKLSGEEKKQLQDQVNGLIKNNEELLHKFDDLERQNQDIAALAASKDDVVARLNETVLQHAKTIEDLTGEKAALIETNSTIEDLVKEKEALSNELKEKYVQIDILKESLDAQIASLKAELDNQTKFAQNLADAVALKDAELNKLTMTLEQMNQEWEMRVDQRGNDVAESWKLHLESRESEFVRIEELLKKEINELEEKTNALVNENNELRKNVDAEIRNEVDRVSALQQQINDRQQYISDLTRTLQEKQGEIEELQREIERINTKMDEEKGIVDAVLEKCPDQTISRTRDGILKVLNDKENELVLLRHELHELRIDCDRKQEQYARDVEEKNRTISSVTHQLQEVQNLKDYENENVQNLQQNLLEYQHVNGAITAQLQAKSAQLEEVLNEQNNLQKTIQDKEGEIINLRQLLEEKQREYNYAVENLSQEYRTSISEQTNEIEALKKRLHDNENHYEELLAAKDTEIEGFRLELSNQSELSSQLEAKMEECKNLQAKIGEQSVLLEEESKQLTELRAIIEEQVLKIEDLKKELFEKSNDYDSLIAEMDIGRGASKDQEVQQHKIENEDLTEPVSRAELDLALYMLHQRDVRCEELTVELTQLLEERDTLQLRLSNAIREKEELGRQTVEESSIGEASGAVPKVTEAAPEADTLTTKLFELKTVGYRKDKTIVDEQELRRFQQLSIMQQHRDVASKLPPEAAARLVDASYTLSRDVQSPSKVLLNWLWGRSTPKVNNI